METSEDWLFNKGSTQQSVITEKPVALRFRIAMDLFILFYLFIIIFFFEGW